MKPSEITVLTIVVVVVIVAVDCCIYIVLCVRLRVVFGDLLKELFLFGIR
jgi:hypothetical protein